MWRRYQLLFIAYYGAKKKNNKDDEFYVYQKFSERSES